ncbi:UDP-glucuronosyltransferase 2B7-like [Sipha flava]|uniref:UDP-glucuronosyltransferase n=1 Tax=Sipha flava TaxID=143950 RepID=A0A2S2PWM2_9HEMI|nr:UDP-glucuronosyltransferase 2B7-like [Sipha flava]
MNHRLSITFLLLFSCYCSGLPNVRPSNILVFLPTPVKSHFGSFKPLLEALVTRGHNLTLVSPFALSPTADDGSPLLYTHVRVNHNKKVSGPNFLDRNSFTNWLPMYMLTLWLGPHITRGALENEVVKDFVLNDAGQYDLVVVENFFHEGFVSLGYKYGVPVVQLLSFAANARVSQWHGNPYDPSYIADFCVGYTAPMTFLQRVDNALAAVFNTWINRLVYVPQQQALVREYFRFAGHERMPDLETMLRNVSLTLINSHPMIGPAVPLVPSFVQVAGMHLKPAQTLPQDLKTILDTSEHGVVYFSLGSVIQSSKMPKETVSLLLSELAKIQQIVLWKWEDDQLPNLPKNVVVRKWFPQNDILAHPNCRLFITHGGIHSVIEAIYHGVPMLSIPVFGDQKHNSVEAESRGFALYVSYFDLTAELFGTKLQKLLHDPRFGEAVSKASSILRDDPIPVLEKAVFWVEYVIRHKGAPHLRTAANDLYWFQYYLLDVIAAISLLLAFVLYLNYKFFSYLLRKTCTAKSSPAKVTKRKHKKQ